MVLAIVVACPATSPCALAARDSPLPLRALADIPLPGKAARFDYQSHDPAAHLLAIAHLGDDAVLVFDTQSQEVVARIAGLSRPHGVLMIPELGRLYVSAPGSHEVVAIATGTWRIVTRIPGGAYPDGMAYVPGVHKLYVSDEAGGAVAVIDVKSNRRVGTIALGGQAGNTQYDAVSAHILTNVQSRNELVAIDVRTDEVIARHPLPGANHNHGLLIDTLRRLAFVACEGNARLLVVDLRTMKVVASHGVGSRPDVLAFDPGLRRLYVAAETGIVSVFRETDAGLEKLGEGRVAPAAHSVSVDERTQRTYFPLQDVEGRPVLRVMEPTPPVRAR
jgi:DNA-binding beta-propeller fold protein YncE